MTAVKADDLPVGSEVMHDGRRVVKTHYLDFPWLKPQAGWFDNATVDRWLADGADLLERSR